MQRIESNTAAQPIPSLATSRLLQWLASLFVLIFIILLALCYTHSELFALPVAITIPEIPEQYISQLTSFLLVFGVVMLVNQLYQQKSKSAI